jgi:hypothetical protein
MGFPLAQDDGTKLWGSVLFGKSRLSQHEMVIQCYEFRIFPRRNVPAV